MQRQRLIGQEELLPQVGNSHPAQWKSMGNSGEMNAMGNGWKYNDIVEIYLKYDICQIEHLPIYY